MFHPNQHVQRAQEFCTCCQHEQLRVLTLKSQFQQSSRTDCFVSRMLLIGLYGMQSVKKGEEDFKTFRKIMSDLLADIQKRGQPRETDTTIAAHLLRIRDPTTGVWPQHCTSLPGDYLGNSGIAFAQMQAPILHSIPLRILLP